MRTISIPLALLALFALVAWPVGRGATAGPYTMDLVAFSGGQASAVAVGYSLTGGAGQPLVQSSSGGSYQLQSGFWALPARGTTDIPDVVAPLVTGRLRSAPNPFSSQAGISFELAAPARVGVEVFDLRGARVCTLLERSMDAGRYHLQWDGRDGGGATVPAGVYWVQFVSGGTRERSRIVRLP
jgi:hypothetical protein